jgi:serine phosphatase RsbU (regulator of sigma subunit)
LPLEVEVLQAVLMPLFTKGEFLGAMLIGQGTEGNILSDRKVELLAGIANQAALAIDAAQLYEAQQEEAWVTTVLLQVAEAVNLQYDLASTLETIVRLMTMLVGVQRCVVFRWQADEKLFVGMKASGLNPEINDTVEGLRMPLGDDVFLEAIVEAKLTIAAGEDKGFVIPSPLQELFDGQAILGVPLVVHNNPVAVMFVDEMDLDGQSGQRRMDILTGVAHQSALAIQTASLQDEALAARGYEREIEVARDIQLSLLPEKPPVIEGWDVAAYYRPARLVGGDFYDFIPLSNGHYAFVMADVADKGIPAAMFMTVCRTLIRAIASSQKTPLETLERVNRLLVRDSRSDLFFTCWFGILNPETGLLQYTSGGHNPPLLVKAQGHVEELRIKGMALGILEPCVLNQAETKLEQGDVLLAYTDGLTEAPRADMIEFGETEVYVTTIKHRHLGADEMVKRMVAAVDRFTRDQPAFDDMTLFAIKCNLDTVPETAS